MSKKTEIACLMLAMMCFSGYHIILYITSPPAPSIFTNEAGYIQSIHGLEIEGTRYDVTFRYGLSFDSLFGEGDPPEIFQPEFYIEGAEAARAAISDTLWGQQISNQGTDPNVLYVPCRSELESSRLMGVRVYATGTQVGSSDWSYLPLLGNANRSSVLYANDAWATFEIHNEGNTDDQ